MGEPADLSPAIVEALYCEALELADETRSMFDPSQQRGLHGDDDDLARIALSCEALRTTTRMMHAIAWLLNQRAFHSGDLTEHQLRRQGPLPPAPEEGHTAEGAVLSPDQLELVARTIRFYARIQRMEQVWQNRLFTSPQPVRTMRERLGNAVHLLQAPHP